MRISDWSSDVCSSDLRAVAQQVEAGAQPAQFELHPLPAQVGYAEGNELIAFGAVIGGRGAGAERDEEIGRASCRGRVCQYVLISVVAVSLKKKHKLKVRRKVAKHRR